MAKERATFAVDEFIKKRFENHFSEFVTVRTEDIWGKTHAHSSELQQLYADVKEAGKKLQEGLSEAQLKLLEKYDEQNTLVESYLKQILYELGFVDGIKIATETDEEIINMYPIFKHI